ncbi:MAG: transcription repressor NadR [Lachnospiraceae bacterium]|nr:transcription repressor NadR [Lachnospiraceae bacterium]
MDVNERREKILEALKASITPLSAAALAKEYGVSRQIIVNDVALLRASGSNIESTPRGYLLKKERSGLVRKVACCHTGDQMREEMYAIVDEGCVIENVIVEHPIYGEITGNLNVASRREVDRFIDKCNASSAAPLSALTEGIHLHTLTCPDEDAYINACEALETLGILCK